ncbi:MAG: molybdate ABC transporter substrate-binding protein [Anaerolineae bacterium CG_4_9_14_3_um_filter_57_17]|nr:MAG: molybdate ABC transporter substrate-binding protein [Anaerolineae bacterium CG_4_9_14_3_um_filter_57_17]
MINQKDSQKKLQKILALLILGVLAVLVTGCGSKEVTIDAYVGDGMIEPMNAIKEAYEAENPRVTINYHFAGSATLEEAMRSLERGDVYMPGAASFIDSLNADGLIVASYPVAYHIPAIIVRAGNTIVTSWDDLAKEGVRLAVSNPGLSSGGKAADAIISKSPLNEKIRANITVLGSDVRSVIQLLVDNEVDAVISWSPDVKLAPGLVTIEIPEEINVRKEIWIAVTGYTTAENEALKFAQFVAGEVGRKYFEEKGFLFIEK